MTRAAVLRDPDPKGSGNLAPSIPPSLGVAVSAVNIGDAGEIERAITAFARVSNSGLIVQGADWRSMACASLR